MAASTSKLNRDLKLEFKNGPDNYELELSIPNDVSGFKVKGSYSKVSINWTWKIYPNIHLHKLVDDARSNITIVEIKIRGL
jgi:hypothetical protein